MIYSLIDSGRALNITAACRLFGVSTSAYYHWLARKDEPAPDTDLRDEIEAITLEFAGYGYRRVTAELARRGFIANHKRVLRIMSEEHLLCQIRKGFVTTTDSSHGLAIYPSLARDLVLSGIDQLWVADITYIRLLREFVYLAVILDAFSRKVVGWHLSQRIDTKLCLAALEMALSTRKPTAGLVHHSDRGVQYASGEYIALLNEHGITVSMSRSGNPYDNAKAESFFKTLKAEEVYLFEYETFGEANMRIPHFIEDVYNQKRLHSSLGYLPPSEFEAKIMTTLA